METGTFIIVKAGVNSTYGGGAVFVELEGIQPPIPLHWYQIPVQWESQMLAVALAAITGNLSVSAQVGSVGIPAEAGPSSEPMCFTLHLALR
jgi:hypothetical protein